MTGSCEIDPTGSGMIAKKKDTCDLRRAKPTGEIFDAVAAHRQAKQLYPSVMARLAE